MLKPLIKGFIGFLRCKIKYKNTKQTQVFRMFYRAFKIWFLEVILQHQETELFNIYFLHPKKPTVNKYFVKW